MKTCILTAHRIAVTIYSYLNMIHLNLVPLFKQAHPFPRLPLSLIHPWKARWTKLGTEADEDIRNRVVWIVLAITGHRAIQPPLVDWYLNAARIRASFYCAHC